MKFSHLITTSVFNNLCAQVTTLDCTKVLKNSVKKLKLKFHAEKF
jgi:hypothetical protein